MNDKHLEGISDKKLKEMCKLGQGDKCCPYLVCVCGGQGFECAYGNSIIAKRIKDGTMNAKGKPCKEE